MSDNPNYPQLNETLLLVGAWEDGTTFQYSWTLRSARTSGIEEPTTYEQARAKLYEQYKQAAKERGEPHNELPR